MTALASHFGGIGAAIENGTPAPALQVTGPSDHAAARRALLGAWLEVVKRPPQLAELQSIQAVALHETGYGQLGFFPGSHNWGAVQLPGTWGASECPPNGFMGQDSVPHPDGSRTTKPVCFRTYSDDVAGAVDLVRNLTTARPRTFKALGSGDADQVAAAMYAERYYAGDGATAAARVGRYAKGIATRAAQIAKALSEPLNVRRHAGVHPSNSPGFALPLAALLGVVVFRHHIGDGGSVHGVVTGALPPASTSTTGIDIFPTFVTPDDAKRYVRETDAAYERTDQEVQASAVTAAFKQSWATQLEGWRKFRDDATQNVGWLNSKATMDQTDRWSKQLTEWHDRWVKLGGQPAGPPPPAPGQGASGTDKASASAGWIQLALLIAGLFGVGYLVRGFRGA